MQLWWLVQQAKSLGHREESPQGDHVTPHLAISSQVSNTFLLLDGPVRVCTRKTAVSTTVEDAPQLCGNTTTQTSSCPGSRLLQVSTWTWQCCTDVVTWYCLTSRTCKRGQAPKFFPELTWSCVVHEASSSSVSCHTLQLLLDALPKKGASSSSIALAFALAAFSR